MASWISSDKVSASGWSEGSVATMRLVLESGTSPLSNRTDFEVGVRWTGEGSASAVHADRKNSRRNVARVFIGVWRSVQVVGRGMICPMNDAS